MGRWFRRPQQDDTNTGENPEETRIVENPPPAEGAEVQPEAAGPGEPEVSPAAGLKGAELPEPGEVPVEAEAPAGASARPGLFRRFFGMDPREEGESPEALPAGASPEEPPGLEAAEISPGTTPEDYPPPPDEVEPETEAAADPEDARKGLFRRFRERLGRTREVLAGGLERLFLGRREVDAEVLEELEELLITADLGVDTTLRLIEGIREKVKRRELGDALRLKEALREEMVRLLTGPPPPVIAAKPWVVLLVGVNGVGKTTTIAKLALRDRRQGLTPLLIAGDTFRAAAVEQLEIWGDRVGAQVVKQKTGADPAAVVFDGLAAAQAREVDTVYVDTAGRLHTKVNLMEELKKIHRTAAKKIPGAPHETLLILDATTGQNALSQVRLFHEAVGVTGIILTKLDGTAKGGMALAVAHETGLPLRYLGVGEGMDDLQPFDPEAFAAAVLG